MVKPGSEIAPIFVSILWISQLRPNRGYSQCITSFQNPKFLLKKPMDLGIGAYKLFLNFLFQRTRIDPQFSKSKPTYHLIFALLRIIQVIILLTRCRQGMIFTERYLNNHYKE